MTTLLTIAELLAGEALISPGGPVDRVTAMGDDEPLWQTAAPHAVAQQRDDAAMPVEALVTV